MSKKESGFYAICPFSNYMSGDELKEKNKLFGHNLKANMLVPKHLGAYTSTETKKEAEEIIKTNYTDLYETGAYPYCALVEINLHGLPLRVESIELYHFDYESYNTQNERYQFKRSCSRFEMDLRPSVAI